MIGVAWNGPGRVPYASRGISFGSHCQTISSSPTLAAVTSSAVEYLVCACSAPTYGHSIVVPGSSAPARVADKRTAKEPQSRQSESVVFVDVAFFGVSLKAACLRDLSIFFVASC